MSVSLWSLNSKALKLEIGRRENLANFFNVNYIKVQQHILTIMSVTVSFWLLTLKSEFAQKI